MMRAWQTEAQISGTARPFRTAHKTHPLLRDYLLPVNHTGTNPEDKCSRRRPVCEICNTHVNPPFTEPDTEWEWNPCSHCVTFCFNEDRFPDDMPPDHWEDHTYAVNFKCNECVRKHQEKKRKERNEAYNKRRREKRAESSKNASQKDGDGANKRAKLSQGKQGQGGQAEEEGFVGRKICPRETYLRGYRNLPARVRADIEKSVMQMSGGMDQSRNRTVTAESSRVQAQLPRARNASDKKQKDKIKEGKRQEDEARKLEAKKAEDQRRAQQKQMETEEKRRRKEQEEAEKQRKKIQEQEKKAREVEKKRREDEAKKQKDAEKKREDEAKKRENEAKKREDEAKKREDEAKKRKEAEKKALKPVAAPKAAPSSKRPSTKSPAAHIPSSPPPAAKQSSSSKPPAAAKPSRPSSKPVQKTTMPTRMKKKH